MEYFLLAYIRHRMQQLNICNYHFEPFIFVTTDTDRKKEIAAVNEYLFLVSGSLAKNTMIESDSNVFIVEDFFASQNLSKIQEFSGQIIVTSPLAAGKQVIEFIHVKPIRNE